MDKTTKKIKIRQEKKVPPVTRVALYAGLAVVLVLLLGSFLPKRGQPATPEAVAGNTPANLANFGLAALAQDTVYYADAAQGGQVMRANFASGATEPLEGVQGTYLNLIGDALYYLAASDGTIHRFSLAGGEDAQLVDRGCTALLATADRLYFIDLEDGEKLYRAALDGSGIEKLSNARMSAFLLAGDQIYYRDMSANNRLYRMGLDGTQPTELALDTDGAMFVSENRLYYTSATNGRLYAVPLDGLDSETPSPRTQDVARHANTSNAYLYFADVGGGSRLCRVPVAGGEMEYLTDEAVYAVQAVGDWILYLNAADGVSWRLKSDLSERQQL